MVTKRADFLGGIGGIAFGVLTVVALFVASPASGIWLLVSGRASA